MAQQYAKLKLEELEKRIETLTQLSNDDTVSRQAVLDLVVRNHTTLSDLNVVMYAPLCKDIKNLPTIIPKEKTEWIPISERLPEFSQDVLLSLRNLDIVTGFRAATEPYFYSYLVDGCYIEPKNVLAWMPLPEPYKEENMDKKVKNDNEIIHCKDCKYHDY